MNYLVAVWCGGVQDFIRVTRRTADLRFASDLLSELASSAAQALEDKGAAILIPGGTSANDNGKQSGISNVVVGNLSITSDQDSGPEETLKEVLDNVRSTLKNDSINPVFQAAENRNNAAAQELDHIKDLLRRKVDEGLFPDLRACWSEYDDESETSWNRLMMAMASTKRLPGPLPRFDAATGSRISSLSGRDYSVTEKLAKKSNVSLGLDQNEQLDAVELFKRLGGRFDSASRSFAPLTRIGVDPWLENLRTKQCETFEEIKCIHRQIAASRGLDVVGKISTPLYSAFPYDGALLIGDNLARAKELANKPTDTGIGSQYDKLETILKELAGDKCIGAPGAYFAIIRGDLDGLGAELSRKARSTLDGVKALSAELAEFTGACCQIATDCRGQWLYAGGDDLLIFVPVEDALRAAQLIRGCVPNGLSISTAITIGHAKWPMAKLLESSENALGRAKRYRKRQSLEVEVLTRSGAPFRWTSGNRTWGQQLPEEFVSHLIKLFREHTLPSGLPYRIATLHRDHPLFSTRSPIRADMLSNLLFKSLDARVAKALEAHGLLSRITDGLSGGVSDLMLARRIANLSIPLPQ